MKYLSFGSVNIDVVFSVDHIALPGETLSSAGKSVHAGGKGGNQAGAMAKAGLSVFLACRLGRDGLFILEKLKEVGVDTSYADVSADFTGQAIIQVSREGQNTIILSSGGNGEIEKPYIESVLSHFERGDVLVAQNEISNNGLVIAEAKKRGMYVVFNPSPFNERITEEELASSSLLFVNEIEGAQIAGIEPGSLPYDLLLDRLQEKLGGTEIVLTVGKDGAYYAGFGERAFAPIVPTKVVDTTAAGDTFLGYFLAARERGCRARQALSHASLASSITVSGRGALESIPTADKVFS